MSLGFAQRTVQEWAHDELMDLMVDSTTGKYQIHRDYLNPSSLRSKSLLRVG
jgi:hypothetical protein